MVNITKMRQQERLQKIKQIGDSINEAVKEKKKIDKKKLVLVAMSNLGISKRTAEEYVDVALFNSGIEI